MKHKTTAVLVADRMTRKVVTLPGSATLREAITSMRRLGIRQIPIVDGERLVGIVTDRDLKHATPSMLSGIGQEEFDRILDTTHVAQIMTRNPLPVTPATSLGDAAKILADRKFGALPVVEGGRLVGIITTSDLLRALHAMSGE